jgi:hypothetical protein
MFAVVLDTSGLCRIWGEIARVENWGDGVCVLEVKFRRGYEENRKEFAVDRTGVS